ncbi:peptidase M15 [Actinotalea ferrariae CF5-4]|uniref:Peptidase M15 n=1 Tax=Actinotalea ferrariae CF5-4 TaxID=948458 RepID=A0A021VMQ1_9CELL|nr:M15 family metallopeptidase [Actinotalea ferrariae]EYR62363.1 peptidase M15 [Actinotalea ferrariae CF5-4]
MDPVAAVTDRIAEIRSQIATVSRLAAGRPPGGVLGTPSGAYGSGAAGASWSPSAGGFDAALETAIAASPGAPGGGAPAAFLGQGVPGQGPAMLGRAAPAWWENPTALAALSGVSSSAAASAGAAPAPASAPVPAVGSGRALVDAKGVPAELRVHGNGKVPAAALSTVAGADGHRLWAPAARSLEALRAAAARDGVSIGVTDSYRPYDVQVDLVRRKGLYSQGGLAAVPGTSNHGWGIAVDLDLDARAQAWMRTHGERYGFVEDVPREPWHWTYRPTH